MSNTKKEKIVDIRVFGVGGGGSNAVNRMIEEGVQDIQFYIVNTDKQALESAHNIPLENRVCIGEKSTKGQGAGANPEKGKESAEESKQKLKELMQGADMVFVTAGMGGGTGTGAAAVVASVAKELNILTVGVVTKPFSFEGKKRMQNALLGIEELKKSCDTLIPVPNDKLLSLDGAANLSMPAAFKKADEVLMQGIKGISDLISTPGVVNLDFADVTNVIKEQGTAHIGVGEFDGEDRVKKAVETAINSPLLETSIHGSTGILLNFASGSVEGLSLIEVNTGATIVSDFAHEDATIIFGTSVDETLGDKVKVTVIATGFDEAMKVQETSQKTVEVEQTTVKQPQIEQNNQENYDDIPLFLRKQNR